MAARRKPRTSRPKKASADRSTSEARLNPAHLTGPLVSATVYGNVLSPAFVPAFPLTAGQRSEIAQKLKPHLRDTACLQECLDLLEVFLARLRVFALADRELRKTTKRGLSAELTRVEKQALTLAETLARMSREVDAARRLENVDRTFPLQGVARNIARLPELARQARENLDREDWPQKRRRRDLETEATRELAEIWGRFARPRAGTLHGADGDWSGPFPAFARVVIRCAIPTYRGRAALAAATSSKRSKT